MGRAERKEREWEWVEEEVTEGKVVRMKGGKYRGRFGRVVGRTKHRVVVQVEGERKHRMLMERNVGVVTEEKEE